MNILRRQNLLFQRGIIAGNAKDDFDPRYKDKIVEMRVSYMDPDIQKNEKHYTASSQKGSSSSGNEVFDIGLECEGVRIQPQAGKKVRVHIYNMVNQGKNTDYTIYRLSEERPTSTLFEVTQDPGTGLWREKIVPTADGDMLYFDTDHFSIYAISTARTNNNAPTISSGSNNVTLDYKGSKQLSVSGESVTWGGGNDYVSVDQSGKITSKQSFIKTGSATITASNVGGTIAFNVKVKPTFWQWIIIILLFGWIWY